MDLPTFFATKKSRDIAALATKAGTSIGYLKLCKYGVRTMSADIAIWLEHATQGELTARELRPDLPWPELSPPVSTTAAALPEAALRLRGGSSRS